MTAWRVSGKGNLALLDGAVIAELEMDAGTRLDDCPLAKA